MAGFLKGHSEEDVKTSTLTLDVLKQTNKTKQFSGEGSNVIYHFFLKMCPCCLKRVSFPSPGLQ